jgi:hypothetical protein
MAFAQRGVFHLQLSAKQFPQPKPVVKTTLSPAQSKKPELAMLGLFK